jgi:hypothetical protein
MSDERADTMDPARASRAAAVDRLNPLPVTAHYRKMTWILDFNFFFDMGDIITLSFAAPAIMKSWRLPIAEIALPEGVAAMLKGHAD